MAVNYSRLVKLFEQKPAPEATMLLQESFAAKDVDYKSIDLGRLFCECFGWNNFLACRAGQCFANDVMEQALQESGQGAVATSAFQNISGQIVYSAIIEKYPGEDMIFQDLIPEVDTKFLDGEKIAGLTEIGDNVAVRSETYPYALAGVGENWIFTPPVLDRGVEVPVTWEAIFNDRTSRLLDYCRDVGKWGRTNKEKRAVDCLIDLNTTRHRYNWRGTTIASYGDNSGSHTWDNLSATNPLVDWTSLNTAEQNLNGILDPFTGEPIQIMATDLIVSKALEHTANRIIHATEIDVATPGYATTGNPTRTRATNPYLNKVNIRTSRYVGTRLVAGSGLATTWFYGDIAKYARYMSAEKLAVVPMPSNSMEEYRRRIVAGWRVNERGAYIVFDPRYINMNTA